MTGVEESASEGAPNLLTVAEAAARLGVTERAIRRRLARPEYAAQTVSTTRRTRTGTRTAAALPPPLMDALLAEFAAERDESGIGTERGRVSETKPEEAGANTEEDGQKAGERGDWPIGRDMQMAAVYDALLREKDARLADQSARIEYLEAALQREQESLAREQSLRLLATPPETSLSETEGKAGDSVAETKSKAQILADKGARRAWWKFWRND